MHGVVFGHRVWICGGADAEEVELRALVRCEDACVSVLAPVFAPRVLNDPELLPVALLVPADDLHDVLTVEAEGVLCAVVDALLVSQEVGVHDHLSDHGAILQELFLNAGVILGEAVVNNLVENTVLSALIGL